MLLEPVCLGIGCESVQVKRNVATLPAVRRLRPRGGRASGGSIMTRNLGLLLAALLVPAAAARAQVTKYYNESEYLAAAARLGLSTFQEGFEDAAAWDVARSPKTAANIVRAGIVWTSNYPNAVSRPGHLSTSTGAAHSGQWGVFSMPHGNPDVIDPNGFMRDGFIALRTPGSGAIYGAGGWFTGTFGGKLAFVLDGDESRFVEMGPLTPDHVFYGVIDTRGFTKFEVREREGTLEDQKFVFADDFTFAVKSGETGPACVSAASFRADALAPGSIGTIFGQGLAASTEAAGALPLPLVLAGTAVTIRDSGGVERPAPLFFVSPGQINLLVPEAARAGPATFSVLRGEQVVARGALRLETVAPGIFTANADGKGPPAAVVVRANPDGGQTAGPVFQCGAAPGSCVTVPIDLGAETDQVFLLLFGTGISGRSALSAVTARIGGANAEVLYAGAQGAYAGLDQINLRLPRSLAGRGEVELIVTVDGKVANTVTLNFR